MRKMDIDEQDWSEFGGRFLRDHGIEDSEDSMSSNFSEEAGFKEEREKSKNSQVKRILDEVKQRERKLAILSLSMPVEEIEEENYEIRELRNIAIKISEDLMQ
jgi:hypothetical protein